MERVPLLYEKHEFFGHGSKETMLSQMNEYYWDGMKKEKLYHVAMIAQKCALSFVNLILLNHL